MDDRHDIVARGDSWAAPVIAGWKRLSNMVTKLGYRAGWWILGRRAGEPSITVLYDEPDGRVVRVDGGAFIDPLWGYVITRQGAILEWSPVNGDVGDAPFANGWRPTFGDRPFRMGVPSPLAFLRARAGRCPAPVLRRPSVLSLRYLWEWNYYHFYFDVIGRLELLEHAGVDDRVPIVLGRYVDDGPFARQVIGLGGLSDREWIVPTDEFVEVDSVLVCHSRRPHRAIADFLVDQLASPVGDDDPIDDGTRLYLKRTGTRQCLNRHELEPILEEHGFVTVDAADLAVADQIALFRTVRHLVADHGAGSTNIVFRGARPLGLLELHHADYMAYDHREICEAYGHYWDEVIGLRAHTPGRSLQGDDFTIDPVAFESGIRRLLAS